MTPALDEKDWILPGGRTRDWELMAARRRADALARLSKAAASFERRAPAAVRKEGWGRGVRFFLDSRGPERDRLLADPALDRWLHLWDSRDKDDWRLFFGSFAGFAASLARSSGRSLEVEAIADSDGHVHLEGGPFRVEFPAGTAGRSVLLRIDRGTTFARGREAVPGIPVRACGDLMTGGVVMHGLARLDAKSEADFAQSLSTAFAHIRARDKALYAEMTGLVRAAIPLVNPKKFGSVSSSYAELRGAICLSHDWDPLLQAETLIHEFCHQKMNQLLLADPILLPGQTDQIFYSPWRSDARRLRGLILGAHAFLNVCAYLLKSLAKEKHPLRRRIALMSNVSRRLYEVETAVRAACAYGRFTEFGGRFMLGLSRETQGLFHAAQGFPEVLLKEARAACDAHRRAHALPLTGLHRKP